LRDVCPTVPTRVRPTDIVTRLPGLLIDAPVIVRAAPTGSPARSAYRGEAVLFKLLDVLLAAARHVPGLVGGFCCAAGFNAYGAERDGGTAIEWSAHCLASR
jgi:hypothetical protein